MDIYRLFGDRLIKLMAFYIEDKNEIKVLDSGRIFHGPYPNPDMFDLTDESDFPVACVTLVDSPVSTMRRVLEQNEIEGSSPPMVKVKTQRLEVSATYQIDVLAHRMNVLWGGNDQYNQGVMSQIILLFAENRWLADDDEEQTLRCRLVSGAQNMDGLEETDRYHRGTIQVYLDGMIITEEDLPKPTEIRVEIDGDA